MSMFTKAAASKQDWAVSSSDEEVDVDAVGDGEEEEKQELVGNVEDEVDSDSDSSDSEEDEEEDDGREKSSPAAPAVIAKKVKKVVQMSKKEKEVARLKELEDLDNILVGYIDNSTESAVAEETVNVQTLGSTLETTSLENQKKKKKSKKSKSTGKGDDKGSTVEPNAAVVDVSQVLKNKMSSAKKSSPKVLSAVQIALEQSKDKPGKKKKTNTSNYSEISY